MKTIKNLYMTPAAAAMTLLLAVSCNDKAYDLSKIDTSASVEADLCLPIGSTEVIHIGDFLNITADEDGLIQVKENGDYVLRLEGNTIPPVDIEIPTLSFQMDADNTEDTDVIFELGGETIEIGGFSVGISTIKGKTWAQIAALYPGVDLSAIDTSIEPIVLENNGEDPEFDIEVNNVELPEAVIDIEDAQVESPIVVKFKLDGGKFTLEGGAKIIFPNFMVIEVNDERLRGEGDHTAVLKDDLEISSSWTELNINVVKIDFTELTDHGLSGTSPKYLNINEKIKIQGSVKGDFKDFDPIPDRVTLKTNIDISAIAVKEANVQLDISATFDGAEITVGELPEFLTAEGVNIDIYNPVLRLDIDNGTDFEPELNADILAWNDKDAAPEDPADTKIHIGSVAPDGEADNKTATVTIPSGEGVIYISRRGGQAKNTSEKDIIVNGMKELFNPLPGKIWVKNIKAGVTADRPKPFTFPETGGTYTIGFGYSLETPLAFGREFEMSQTLPIEGLGGILSNLTKDEGKIQLEFHNFEISFWLHNTLPLGVEITAIPQDGEGNNIDGLDIRTTGRVQAGSIRRPTESLFKIIIAGGEHLGDLDKILLSLKIRGTEISEIEGTPLNENQGVQLKRMKARLTAKVSTDFADLIGGGNSGGSEDNNEEEQE